MTNLAHDHSQVEAAAGVALVAAASLTADTVLPPPEAPAVIAPAPAERTKRRPNVPMNSLNSRLARWRLFVQFAW